MEFVFMKETKEVLELAKAGEKNVLLWGPAGHGKSEFVSQWIQENFSKEDVFMLQFHQGITEEKLLGGIRIKDLEERGDIRYNIQKSFMNYPVVVFEEIFDAPASTLLVLKDILTRKKFADGKFRYPLKTKIVIAITNKDPSELYEMGEHIKALIERFPLQLNVKWKSYNKDSWKKFFNTVVPHIEAEEGIKISSSVVNLLINELSAIAETGNRTPSPRTVVHAMQSMIAKAKVEEKPEVELEDAVALKYVLDFEPIAEKIEEKIKVEKKKEEERKRIERIKERFNEIKSIGDIIKEGKALKGLINELSQESFKHLKGDKENLLGDMVEYFTNLKEKVFA